MHQKTIWKNFLIFGIPIFITLLVIISCQKEADKIKTVDYIYRNSSGKDLELMVFNSNNSQIKNLQKNSSIIVTNESTNSTT